MTNSAYIEYFKQILCAGLGVDPKMIREKAVRFSMGSADPRAYMHPQTYEELVVLSNTVSTPADKEAHKMSRRVELEDNYTVEPYFDPDADQLCIKIHKWNEDEDGLPLNKQALMLTISKEKLRNMPFVLEGEVLPRSVVDLIPELILDAITSETSKPDICNDGLDISMCCGAPTKTVFGTIKICTKCGK